MTVCDPQTNGMGEGEYSSELFLRGWHEGNEFGYAAILRDPARRQDLFSLPGEVLMKAWSWNHSREVLQGELGESKFVPRIMFLLVAGRPATAAVWPDGIPIAVPDVDYFIVPRKELAPRRFLRRVEDQTLVSKDDALPIFTKFRSGRSDGNLVLNYVIVPREMKTFVESLPSDEREIKGVPVDSVLNRELVEKYVT
jgi:hypothetical protein